MRRRKRSGASLAGAALLLLACMLPAAGAKKKTVPGGYSLVAGTVFQESGYALANADVTLTPDPQPDGPAVKVKNPLNENQAVMRTTLVPGLLRAVDLAARRGERDARLFTLGSIFLGGGGDRELPEERASFAELNVLPSSAGNAVATLAAILVTAGAATS